MSEKDEEKTSKQSNEQRKKNLSTRKNRTKKDEDEETKKKKTDKENWHCHFVCVGDFCQLHFTHRWKMDVTNGTKKNESRQIPTMWKMCDFCCCFDRYPIDSYRISFFFFFACFLSTLFVSLIENYCRHCCHFSFFSSNRILSVIRLRLSRNFKNDSKTCKGFSIAGKTLILRWSFSITRNIKSLMIQYEMHCMTTNSNDQLRSSLSQSKLFALFFVLHSSSSASSFVQFTLMSLLFRDVIGLISLVILFSLIWFFFMTMLFAVG